MTRIYHIEQTKFVCKVFPDHSRESGACLYTLEYDTSDGTFVFRVDNPFISKSAPGYFYEIQRFIGICVNQGFELSPSGELRHQDLSLFVD